MQAAFFVDHLKKMHGANLLAVILYGSSLGEDFKKGISDYNVMILLHDLSSQELLRASSISRRWVAQGNPPPLYVDKEYIQTSRDVFPIEFTDIKEHHQILYGEDPFVDFAISNEHLRLECESELKAQILGTRAFVLMNPSKRKIRKMLLKSTSSFFAVLRGVLRLGNEPVPQNHRLLLKKISEKLRFDTSILESLLDVREGLKKISHGETLEYLESYLTTLKKLARLIDTL